RAGQRDWLEWLEREHDNLRAALDWSRGDEGDAELGLRLGAALQWFWVMRGYLTEGRECLTVLLTRTALDPPSFGEADPGSAGTRRAARAKAQASAGLLMLHLGEHEESFKLSSESLATAREMCDVTIMAPSLSYLGMVTQRQGSYAAARGFFEE